MLKKAIRSEFLERRLQFGQQELIERTDRMVKQFANLPLPRVNYLLSYYPLSERNEFDIALCATQVQIKFPDVKLSWPRIDSTTLEMEAYMVQKDGLYAKNRYNILEPLNGEWIQPELIDLVFVPLIAFDQKGFRVGYGKGFYDRYLTRCRPEVIKIGFSFFEALEQIDDIDGFDVPLSFCITPSRIYEF
jgi:5-formyltetrahydrofolate cyclo-ligase